MSKMKKKESVKVFVRFRPREGYKSKTKMKNDVDIWKQENEGSLRILMPSRGQSRDVISKITKKKKFEPSITKSLNTIKGKRNTKKFSFDGIFDENVTQEQFYNATAKTLIDDVFKGINVTIFAYGNTGSGKTYTQIGSESNPGISTRLLSDIYERVEKSDDLTVSMKTSFVQVYNEKLMDLLDVSNTGLKVLQVTNTKRNRYTYVDGARTEKINNLYEMRDLMKRGFKNRAVEKTELNEVSSRSHAIIFIDLVQINKKLQTRKSSRITLIDCAGSENVKESKVEGKKMSEAKAINKSLLQLSLVIKAIVENEKHVPYRNSILTHILSSSLGGNSITYLNLCCHPGSKFLRHTYNTLCFGRSAKLVKNTPMVNQEMTMKQYKTIVKQLKTELKSIKMDNEKLKSLLQKHGLRMDHTIVEITSSEAEDVDVDSDYNEYIDPSLMSNVGNNMNIIRALSPKSESTPELDYQEVNEHTMKTNENLRKKLSIFGTLSNNFQDENSIIEALIVSAFDMEKVKLDS